MPRDAPVIRATRPEKITTFPPKASVAELRAGVIACRLPHGAVQAIDRNKSQRIRPDEFPHAFEIVLVREQILAVRRVDAIETGMGGRRTSNTEMNFRGAGIA